MKGVMVVIELKSFFKNIVPIPNYRGYRVAICLSLLGDG